MANPYPMQPMQPMMAPGGGAPGGGAPGGGGTTAPVRRGTSKAVPVVVSAGLAIGVFCGLLFGLGVDKDEAKAATTETTAQNDKKSDGDVAKPFQPERKDVKVPSLAPQPADKKDAGSGSGSGANAGSGSGSGSAEPPKPAKLVGKLIVEVVPESAAKKAKIIIDGTEIEGMTWELDMTDLGKDKKPEDVKKEVRVSAKASGYRDSVPTKVELVADHDTKVKIEMIKRYSGGNLPRVQQPVVPKKNGGNKKPPGCKKPPCGLIDI